MSDLTGTTSLVTGASRGIGRALAVDLARGGPTVFLAGDASSYVTGQALVVDGGQTAA